VRTGALFTAFASAVLCATLTGLPGAAAGLPRTELKTQTLPPPEDRIDINHASMNQLLKVPGMTRSWAGRIVRFRPYHTKADLVERGVVSSQVYDRIKDDVIAHREKQ
jgi:DNA uptake protein ComE-like DNA-binding protein